MRNAWIDIVDSSVSNDGRGLKREVRAHEADSRGDSSVSNDGRGLKLDIREMDRKDGRDSSVSNDGRGLKRLT